jgi:phenylacetate-CoA ligase
VPFHADRLRQAGIDPAAELTEATWSRVPVLTRRDVRDLEDALNAGVVPASHGAVNSATSGGSSGVPVRVRKTALDNLFWNALHLREEIWHRDDPLGLIARIRRVPPGATPEQRALIESGAGLRLPNWGPPTHLVWETGEIVLLDDRVPIADQIRALQTLQPAYLHTFPSNLRLLLAHCRETATRIPSIRSVWTMSETVDPTMRALCREILGCPIIHNYTSAEVGYMALQCPSGEHFHVQSETLYLEVLRPDGQPCEPGEIGRVVVTPLHNFATPLLRYEIGDEAELGGPCACGRGLPVLRRIVGRTFDYVTLPSGRRRRVDTGYYQISTIPAVREFQIIQRDRERIEILLVLARPLTDAERAEITAKLADEFGVEFNFVLTACNQIDRTDAGKLRAFISELPAQD